MVETKTSKAAEMAGFIEANHRWCITGTPVQSNFPGDLYGLLSFLRASPYQERSWFNKVIERPFQQQRLQQVQNNKNLHQHKVEQEKEFVYQLFRRLMWRNTKEDVREEVRLPRQHQHTTLLPFSTVEAHFYRKQHEECTAVLQRKLADYFSSSPSSSHWSAHSLGKILHPVLKLRQVCCHPQVGGGASAKFYSLQKNTMTMEGTVKKEEPTQHTNIPTHTLMLSQNY